MEIIIKIKIYRVFIGIFFAIIMICLSIWLISVPKIFIRNVFMKEWHIITLGIISILYFIVLLYSLLNILFRPYGIIISEKYFNDNSKYEAIGEIKWDKVSKIKRIKKTSIQIFFKENIINEVNNHLLKKILLMIHNWDYKNSIIISSALLECDIEFLEEKIVKAYKKARNMKFPD
ncbi:STM3941 family protein [Flavobacterium tegetincola]|uniref:STM3941 family protein n=1 Tax=Flavobacterium tegetincola TaxID=150172 RepID=UPI0003FF50CB|nr:STM3941 family protein [Flavobacterium tegetincola]